jgi:hypothetical protein
MVHSPWQFKVMAGWYVTTMILPSDSFEFGYTLMPGPQLFPVLSRTFAGGSSASAYAKYSPVITSESVLNLSNGEAALGGLYRLKPNAHGRSIFFSVDLAIYTLTLDGVRIHSSSVSLGVGYDFL